MAERSWNVGEVIAEQRERAVASGLPVIDLGQGAPTDPTPAVIRTALAEASDAPGYPATAGTPQLRASYAAWSRRRLGAAVPESAVLPTIGSKEFIASLPSFLGLGTDSLIVIPRLAYPTYRAGAQRVGARIEAADSLVALGPGSPDLLWLNNPANPTGQVLPVDHLRKVVDWCRQRGTLLVSDECYLELGPTAAAVPSVLRRDVNGGDLRGLLALHSLSKRSAMAGYRVGFAAGDPALLDRLLMVRRDAGLIVPAPVQHAARVALDDDEHVERARSSYNERRALLRAALVAAGLRVDHSEAGLFLWATMGRPDRQTADRFADQGILVAPGSFYGPGGAEHVRLSITAPESDLRTVAQRMGTVAGRRRGPAQYGGGGP